MAIDRRRFKSVGTLQTERTWPEKGESLAVGDSIEGTFLQTNTDVGANKSNIYVLETAEGELVGVWGNTVLDAKFTSIAKGSLVAIEYLGTKSSKKSGKPYHDFFVGIADAPEEETVEAAGVSVTDDEDIPF